MNPRYAAFIRAHGKQPNWVYMAFIDQMHTAYAKTFDAINTPNKPFPITDDDDFTNFINEHAAEFSVKI